MTETVFVDSAEREITIDLPRFGQFTYREAEVLEFPWGLPGFAKLRRFIALSLESQERFVWLQSLDDLSVALPVADPWQIFPEYAPQLPSYALQSIEVQSPEDFVTLCVVVVSPGAVEMTMNLLAPLIVNLQKRVARQVTLETGGYSTREPVPRRAPAAPAPAGASIA